MTRQSPHRGYTLTEKGLAATAQVARPKVEIRTAGTGQATRHVVWCSTEGCMFVYAAAVKTDAQEQARLHRANHRNGWRS